MRPILSEKARLARANFAFTDETVNGARVCLPIVRQSPRTPGKLTKKIDPRLHRGVEQIRRVMYDEGDEPFYGFGDD